MKGILGRKIGMTSMFLSTGKQIPVTLIQIGENVVTKVLTKKSDGYTALQLASFEKKVKQTSKPEIGHFKKSKSTPKRFVKEIRGMEGTELGTKVSVSVFKPGEYVDVTGVSKGKGFAGTIKRWNQKIGPMSHGGGGGSKPRRQTGSLGTMAQKRVFKGMTMPGHLGAEQKTIQNLEIINIDEKNNLLVVKGSIPGPKKGFVIVKENAKSIKPIEAAHLVDLHEMHLKNELLEEAKKYAALINTDMSIDEMTDAINKARIAKEAEWHASELAEQVKTKQTTISDITERLSKAKENVEKLEKESGAAEEIKVAKELVEQLDHQLTPLKADLKDLESKLAKANSEAEDTLKIAKAAMLEEEKPEEEEPKEAKDTKGDK